MTQNKNDKKMKHLRPVPNVSKGEVMEWTKEQRDAIYESDNNILVAAAARKWKDSCVG